MVKPHDWNAVIGPSLFASVAIVLLVYDHVQRQVTDAVFWLSLALIAAICCWLVGKTATAIAREHRMSLTDELTGLPNAGQLTKDLATTLADESVEASLLIMTAVEGLAGYNEHHGREAGDQLLIGFARGLNETALALGGRAYRSNSGFAVLAPLAGRLAGAVASAVATTPLSSHPDDGVTLSYGEVTLPTEARDPTLAFQIAAHRLAVREQRQRTSVRGQLRDVLLAILDAHRPDLRRHRPDTAYWILAVGRELGLQREELDDAVLAAELRDIGLLAIPVAAAARQAIGDSGGLDRIREHPVAGEGILRAAPALAAVATLVRSANEHVDGSGYPDRLRGDAIPLGARIIAACAAFAALIATAPSPGRETADACAELRRAAGTWFDPEIVEALVRVTREAPTAPEPAAALPQGVSG